MPIANFYCSRRLIVSTKKASHHRLKSYEHYLPINTAKLIYYNQYQSCIFILKYLIADTDTGFVFFYFFLFQLNFIQLSRTNYGDPAIQIYYSFFTVFWIFYSYYYPTITYYIISLLSQLKKTNTRTNLIFNYPIKQTKPFTL